MATSIIPIEPISISESLSLPGNMGMPFTKSSYYLGEVNIEDLMANGGVIEILNFTCNLGITPQTGMPDTHEGWTGHLYFGASTTLLGDTGTIDDCYMWSEITGLSYPSYNSDNSDGACNDFYIALTPNEYSKMYFYLINEEYIPDISNNAGYSTTHTFDYGFDVERSFYQNAQNKIATIEYCRRLDDLSFRDLTASNILVDSGTPSYIINTTARLEGASSASPYIGVVDGMHHLGSIVIEQDCDILELIPSSCTLWLENGSSNPIYDYDNCSGFIYVGITAGDGANPATRPSDLEDFLATIMWSNLPYTKYGDEVAWTPADSSEEFATTNISPGTYSFWLYSYSYTVIRPTDLNGSIIAANTTITTHTNVSLYWRAYRTQEELTYDPTKCPTRQEILDEQRFVIKPWKHSDPTATQLIDNLICKYQEIYIINSYPDLLIAQKRALYGTYNYSTKQIAVQSTIRNYSGAVMGQSISRFAYTDVDTDYTSSAMSVTIDDTYIKINPEIKITLPQIYVLSSTVGVTLPQTTSYLTCYITIPIEFYVYDGADEFIYNATATFARNSTRYSTSSYDASFGAVSYTLGFPAIDCAKFKPIYEFKLCAPTYSWSYVTPTSGSGCSAAAVGEWEDTTI